MTLEGVLRLTDGIVKHVDPGTYVHTSHMNSTYRFVSGVVTNYFVTSRKSMLVFLYFLLFC